MRKILTAVYRYDRCVTEFVRITNSIYPGKVFLRSCPELTTGGATDSGVPVYVQLLGSDCKMMAENAKLAVELGAPGIDINFGCPAKTVNRHGGGSALLRTPAVVGDIVKSVRDAVDPSIPVTAKMRLGFDDSESLLEIATGIEAAGACELCVHARTRNDGYKPPAHWSEVAAVRRELSIPVIVNGEVWNVNEAQMACADSGCCDIMLGRGALAMPDLANRIAASVDNSHCRNLEWGDVLSLLELLLDTAVELPVRVAGNRTKQWLSYLIREYSGARDLFSSIKRLNEIDRMGAEIQRHRLSLTAS